MNSAAQKEIIAAIITPPGEGGVGAIRVAGDGALALCAPFLNWGERKDGSGGGSDTPEAFMMRYSPFAKSPGGEALDETLAVWMPRGKSYTGDEQVEIFCHGGMIVLRSILQTLFDAGAKPAEPGEFTKRAFLNDRIDLTRAEAVAEMISAKSEFALGAARDNLFGKTGDLIKSMRERLVTLLATLESYVDFPEEEIDSDDYDLLLSICEEVTGTLSALIDSYRGGALIRDGFKIALAGRPNAGKSSLFNALLRKNRAIVSQSPGATRDYLSEWITLGEFTVMITDTAGLRETSEEIESQGQNFAKRILSEANLTLWLVDSSIDSWPTDAKSDLSEADLARTLIVANKTDLAHKEFGIELNVKTYPLSCKTGEGLAELEKIVLEFILKSMPDQTDGLIVTSERHLNKFREALGQMRLVMEGIAEKKSPELIAFDARQATRALDEITGVVYTDDILEQIFSKFCIGK
ncbi:MAG: tRNA uridine-5-carboxymethylaminomethyl(34) synthesis GTPase MnmE [candidate division Zixibacteria bacterium]|nr:tRNA uridine-5-carboxymethylaminomethyl(34) synthesis GTPase MnmE [candidate division Zixibacteria bacterium]